MMQINLDRLKNAVKDIKENSYKVMIVIAEPNIMVYVMGLID